MKINLMKLIKLKKLKNSYYINGQASLEFVLVIPVLVLVIMIVSQLGILSIIKMFSSSQQEKGRELFQQQIRTAWHTREL